jgi:hypothetical protein
MRSEGLFKHKGLSGPKRLLKTLFFALSLLFLLARCGSNESKNEKRINNPIDQQKARSVAKDFYRSILGRDSVKMYEFFSADIDSFVPRLVKTIHARNENWGGETDSFEVVLVNTSVIAGEKTDSVDFTVTISAFYAYDQSKDVLHIKKIGSGPFEVYDYDFDDLSIRDCSDSRFEEVRPLFADLTESLANGRDDEVPGWFRSDETFYSDVLELRNEFFPQNIQGNLKAEYHAGYFRQYCGSQNNCNGFLTYKVSLGDTAERYITYVFSGNTSEYNVYRIVMDYTDDSDQPADLDLAKQLAREIFRMMRRNDYLGYFNALHEEFQYKENGSPLTESETKDMVERFKELGRFDDFDKVTTLSVKKTDGPPVIYYAVIAKTLSDEGEQALVELSFKSDENGKIKLCWMEEL